MSTFKCTIHIISDVSSHVLSLRMLGCPFLIIHLAPKMQKPPFLKI